MKIMLIAWQMECPSMAAWEKKELKFITENFALYTFCMSIPDAFQLLNEKKIFFLLISQRMLRERKEKILRWDIEKKAHRNTSWDVERNTSWC